MKRWEFGQVRISLPVIRLLAICGGMLRWHPLHVPPTTATTARPPRCLRIRSYLFTSDRSHRSSSRLRSASREAIRPCSPSSTVLISAPSRAITASFSASACSAASTCFFSSPCSRASLLISSSAVWLVFFAMSSSRASAAYSRGVFSSFRRDSHLRTFSFSSWRSCSFCRRARSLSARRPRTASRWALAWLRSASICLRRVGCFSASLERSRILRSTCCSSSSAFSFSRDNVCLRAGLLFRPCAARCQRSGSAARSGRTSGPARIRAQGAAPAGKWARQESNLHATGYEPAALSVELRARDRTHTTPGGGIRPHWRRYCAGANARPGDRAGAFARARRRDRPVSRKPPRPRRACEDHRARGSGQRIRALRLRGRMRELAHRSARRARGRRRGRLSWPAARIRVAPSVRRRRPILSRRALPRRKHAGQPRPRADRKSTRLNSSHGYISYAVFCLKKKKQTNKRPRQLDRTYKEDDATERHRNGTSESSDSRPQFRLQ